MDNSKYLEHSVVPIKYTQKVMVYASTKFRYNYLLCMCNYACMSWHMLDELLDEVSNIWVLKKEFADHIEVLGKLIEM